MFKGASCRIAAGAILCFTFAGCSVARDMKRDSGQIKDTLTDLSQKGDHIAKRADDLEREMKKKESADMFFALMERLFGENGKDGRSDQTKWSSPESEMLLYAESALRSLMFQFWKGDFFEAHPDALDHDFDISAAMFFTRVNRYIPRDFKINPASLADFNLIERSYKGLASLAARLEQTEDSYKKSLARAGLPEYSLYRTIIEALKDRHLAEQRSPLARTKTRILQWQREAIYILQLRHNYLPMMVHSRLSDFNDRGDASRAWNTFIGDGQTRDFTDGKWRGWVSNAELTEWTHWLNQAAETRAQLRALGIEPEYNSIFAKILARLDFGQARLLSAEVTAASDRVRLERAFAEAYQAVTSEMK